ncbi:hypothetical protein Zmor_001437 [Zophobas morio]|uniref:Uncharacterized protein n=1 Tax=Zophobas morio TaxID=2755281 RepID=A0AA38MPA6_9CUCU|nr:hypothetical protein Zmor_001437 [Zophobas morio]
MRKSEGYIISSTDSTDVNCFDSSQLHQKTVSTLEMETVQALLHLQNSQKKDKNIQVTSGDLVAPFISTLKSDNDLNTMAGIPSFLLFNAIVANCEIEALILYHQPCFSSIISIPAEAFSSIQHLLRTVLNIPRLFASCISAPSRLHPIRQVILCVSLVLALRCRRSGGLSRAQPFVPQSVARSRG